jgi:hypothetical protein
MRSLPGSASRWLISRPGAPALASQDHRDQVHAGPVGAGKQRHHAPGAIPGIRTLAPTGLNNEQPVKARVPSYVPNRAIIGAVRASFRWHSRGGRRRSSSMVTREVDRCRQAGRAAAHDQAVELSHWYSPRLDCSSTPSDHSIDN